MIGTLWQDTCLSPRVCLELELEVKVTRVLVKPRLVISSQANLLPLCLDVSAFTASCGFSAHKEHLRLLFHVTFSILFRHMGLAESVPGVLEARSQGYLVASSSQVVCLGNVACVDIFSRDHSVCEYDKARR